MFRRINASAQGILHLLLISLFSVLVADVLWGVLTRYLLGGQARWSEELARLLMVWLGLLGAALACREEKHLGLDIVVRQWPEALQAWVRIFYNVCVGSFALVVMVWGGGHLVAQRLAAGQMLPALGISKAWFYLALPVSGLLIVLFSVELLGQAWKSLRGEGGQA
jgi:TRAP-type C4-dicarboxylate transport system permease small subunit